MPLQALLAFAAELWDEKGKEIPVSFCFLKTDCYEGETVGYETQFLENFDSRKYPYGWKNTGFDADGWEKPVPAVWADYTLTKHPRRCSLTWNISWRR